MNHFRLGLVGRFTEENGRIYLPAEQFDGLGFRLDDALVTAVGKEKRVYLDRVPGLTWRVNTGDQSIDLEASFDRLKVTRLSVAPRRSRVESRSDWGALISYDVFGEWALKKNDLYFSRTLSTNLEARVFSPWFTASSTGFVTYSGSSSQFVRLDSTITIDDPDKVWRLSLGDSTTAGPVFLRPFRFGGVQWSTNFSLRPDLVTTPMPSLTTNVPVPSTIDVLIDGARRYSKNVDPGVFRLTDLPVVAGDNSISVVVTDQAGRRTQLVLPLYASPDLLAKGVTDFGFAAGAARRGYSITSNEYDGAFLTGYATHGLTDRLTIAGAASFASHYGGADLGAAVNLAQFAVAEATARFSDGPNGQGWAGLFSLTRTTQRFSFGAQYAVADNAFRDLPALFGYARFKQQVTASAGANFGGWGHVDLVYAVQQPFNEARSAVTTASYSVNLFRHRLNLSTSAYVQNIGQRQWGASIGLSFALGRWGEAFLQETAGSSGQSQLYQVQGEAFDRKLRWEAQGVTGDFSGGYVQADWDDPRADLHLRAAHSGGSNALQAEVAQTLVLTGDRLFLVSRINDAFTVVETPGVPGVRVARENRIIGRTDVNGDIFVNGLVSNAPNAISIVPTDLPLDVTIPNTAVLVAPRFGGGTVTRFDVQQVRSAIIVLRLIDGKPPPVGAAAAFNGGEEPAVVGYGGEMYVRGLKAGLNRVVVSWTGGGCSASFTDTAKPGQLPRLGPFTCAP